MIYFVKRNFIEIFQLKINLNVFLKYYKLLLIININNLKL